MNTMERNLRKGDRVRVQSAHLWMPDRHGIVKHVQNKTGNRFIVKFDGYELGMWHDDDGDPVLQLGERDLVLVQDRLSLAA